MTTLFAILLISLIYGESITIDTKLGKIEGIKTGKISAFKNIPYAEPPINELRWKPTKPLPNNYKFNGTYNGTSFGNACPQQKITAYLMTNNSVLSEDCLYLSIFTPYQFNKQDKLKNVLFWVHGGGLTIGSANTYNGDKLSEYKDTIVVVFNYRLGIQAFLVDPALSDNPTGNGGANGFLDMIEALKFVKKHISSFGGNPNEVTIIGESGGGWGVCGLLISPLARGLFKRSIQMSGSCIESIGKFFSKEEGWRMSKIIKDSNGVKTIDELRNIDMETIIAKFAFTLETILPSIDGYVFPKNTLQLVKSGSINGESTMIGTTIRESFIEKPFNMGKSAQNRTDLNNFYYKYLYDTQAELMKEYYPFNNVKEKIYTYGESEFDNNTATLIHTVFSTDCWVRCGSLKQAELIASNDILKNTFPVYFYQYGYIKKPYDQVSHGYDVIGLFGYNAPWISGGVPYSEELTKITMDFFGDYANDKHPSINGIQASLQNGYYIEILDKMHIKKTDKLDILRNRCRVYPKLGYNIYRKSVCIGFDVHDLVDYILSQNDAGDNVGNSTIPDESDDGDSHAGNSDASNKQEI